MRGSSSADMEVDEQLKHADIHVIDIDPSILFVFVAAIAGVYFAARCEYASEADLTDAYRGNQLTFGICRWACIASAVLSFVLMGVDDLASRWLVAGFLGHFPRTFLNFDVYQLLAIKPIAIYPLLRMTALVAICGGVLAMRLDLSECRLLRCLLIVDQFAIAALLFWTLGITSV